jgi:hypothetical protein
MTRQTRRPLLQVQESFEITRFSPECLIEAYRRVVPTQTKAIRRTAEHRRSCTPVHTSRSQGGKHV